MVDSTTAAETSAGRASNSSAQRADEIDVGVLAWTRPPRTPCPRARPVVRSHGDGRTPRAAPGRASPPRLAPTRSRRGASGQQHEAVVVLGAGLDAFARRGPGGRTPAFECSRSTAWPSRPGSRQRLIELGFGLPGRGRARAGQASGPIVLDPMDITANQPPATAARGVRTRTAPRRSDVPASSRSSVARRTRPRPATSPAGRARRRPRAQTRHELDAPTWSTSRVEERPVGRRGARASEPKTHGRAEHAASVRPGLGCEVECARASDQRTRRGLAYQPSSSGGRSGSNAPPTPATQPTAKGRSPWQPPLATPRPSRAGAGGGRGPHRPPRREPRGPPA